MAEYKIYATLYSETRSGSAWHYNEIKTRLIKITNCTNHKSVIVSNRKIDSNFKKLYNRLNENRSPFAETDNPLIIEEYYRTRLGIDKTQTLVELNIVSVKDCSLDSLKYLANHPNDSIRIAYYLAVISIILSLISILPLHDWRCVICSKFSNLISRNN